MGNRHHSALVRSVADELITWRRGVLEDAGFPSELAQQLAEQSNCDLHRLLNLVDRGCPPSLAARILAPL